VTGEDLPSSKGESRGKQSDWKTKRENKGGRKLKVTLPSGLLGGSGDFTKYSKRKATTEEWKILRAKGLGV